MVRNIGNYQIVVAPAYANTKRNWYYGTLLCDNKVVRGVYGEYAGCIRALYSEMERNKKEEMK